MSMIVQLCIQWVMEFKKKKPFILSFLKHVSLVEIERIIAYTVSYL